MDRIRVVLVDDHPVVHDGIRSMLADVDDIQLVGEAETGAKALELMEEMEEIGVDVLLLDMELPDIAGTQVAQAIRQNHPEIKILSLSAHDNSIYVRQLLELGAAGYLLKDEAPDLIVEAIRGVAHGQTGWISRGISARLTEWMQSGDLAGIGLSPRERETLDLLVQGKTNQAIAAELNISEKTVEKHVKAVFDKLHVNSRVEAAVFAIKQGIVKD